MPTLRDVEAAAKRRIPDFAFGFVHGGTGDNVGVARNRAALDGVEIVPRYGSPAPVQTGVTLFGQLYASPIGIAPTGLDGVIWPGATHCLIGCTVAPGFDFADFELAEGDQLCEQFPVAAERIRRMLG